MAHQRAAVGMQTQPATVNTSMHFTPGKRKVVKPAPTSLCWRRLATRSQHSLFHTHTHTHTHTHSTICRCDSLSRSEENKNSRYNASTSAKLNLLPLQDAHTH